MVAAVVVGRRLSNSPPRSLLSSRCFRFRLLLRADASTTKNYSRAIAIGATRPRSASEVCSPPAKWDRKEKGERESFSVVEFSFFPKRASQSNVVSEEQSNLFLAAVSLS